MGLKSEAEILREVEQLVRIGTLVETTKGRKRNMPSGTIIEVVESVETKTSKAGKEYAKVQLGNGKEAAAFDEDVIDALKNFEGQPSKLFVETKRSDKWGEQLTIKKAEAAGAGGSLPQPDETVVSKGEGSVPRMGKDDKITLMWSANCAAASLHNASVDEIVTRARAIREAFNLTLPGYDD